MTDQPPESDDATGPDNNVLRPFTPSELPDLPPVEGSSVVIPEPQTATVSDATSAADDFWAPDEATAAAGGPISDAPAVDEPEVGQLIPDDPDPYPAPATATVSAPAPVSEPPAGPGPSAGSLPPASAAPDTVTVPRNVLTLAGGVAAVLIVALFFLWQSAGGEDGEAQPASGDTAGQGDDTADTGSDTATGTDNNAEVAALEDEVSSLGSRVGELEAELAAVPPPALAGSSMRRIVVAADASFVSLGNQGLAVIGPFGGYAAVDPATNAVTATAQVATGATRVMRTDSAVWITNYTDNQIVRVDAVANTVRSVFDFPGPDGIAKLGPTLVVASFDGGFVAQVDPATGDILNEIDVLGKPSDIWVDPDEQWVWVALFDTGEVVKIDAATFEVVDRVTVGAGPVGLTGHDGLLWVANNGEGTVTAVDMEATAVTMSVAVGEGPTAAAVYQGDLWVSVTDSGELVQIDRSTGAIITRTPLGSSNRGGPTGMTTGAGSLWVAMQGERSVVRVSLAE